MERLVGALRPWLQGLGQWSVEAPNRNVLLYASVGALFAVFGFGKVRLYGRLIVRDLHLLYELIMVKLILRRFIHNDTTVPLLFRKVVARDPDKVVLIGRNRQWTRQQVEDESNRVANFFAAKGFGKGDSVALFMNNRPEYVIIWLGLSKIGVVTALINTNLRLKPLVHSISVVDCKAVIFTPQMIAPLLASQADLADGCAQLKYFLFDGDCPEAAVFQAERIDEAIAQASVTPPAWRGSVGDRLMYVYTSGTTGLPKAAVIKHCRYIQIGLSIAQVMKISEQDVFYVYLPFYHAAAAILGMSHALLHGTTSVVGEKFSASRFWTDCVQFNVTVTQYIGEVCRYLLMQPGREDERRHRVRLMFGNGLRRDVWTQFQKRFCLGKLVEIYGSTEGTTSLANLDNTPGAVGYFPLVTKIVPRWLPLQIFRVDPVTGVPLRDGRGRCIPCRAGETGEIVARIRERDPMTVFDGYADRAATAKKIYTDCLEKGDQFFASGDLVHLDALGYVYFKDRTGDTFRWKAENVSTMEVENVVTAVINDPAVGCVVYGVEVPGTEGRAGMLTLADPEGRVDLDSLLKGLREALPAYAVPLFVRRTSREDTTGTFKMTKVNFQKAGFDLERCHPDPVYILDTANKSGRYIPLDQEIIDKLRRGEIRL